MKRTSNQGILIMSVTAIMWSIGGVLIKFIPWNPLVICGYRGLISAIIVGIYLKLTHQKLALTKRSLLLAFLICSVSVCFVIANKMTTAANAIVLQYTAPIFLLIICAIFRKQRFRIFDYATVALTMFGIVLFFLDQLSGGALLGNLLAVLSGLVFAGVMFVNSEGSEIERLNGIFQGHLLSGIVGITFSFFCDTPFTQSSVLAVVALGVFQLGIPYILFVLAARNCSALTISLLSAFEPILNPVWVFLVFGERPGSMALLGALIVIISVSLWCVLDIRSPQQAGSA